jgi:hypothetical protein
MKKIKSLKQIISLAVMFSLIVSIMPVMSLSAIATNDSADESEVSSANQMLHFVMRIRWGNVIGEPKNISEADFGGSVDVNNDIDSNASISLERTLLFEKHSNEADKITGQTNHQLSWNSLIYNHWDGVKVLVSSPAGNDVTIFTEQGNITKTAKQWYDLNEPFIEDVGESREIVVKVYPIKNPKYFLKVLWGNTRRADYEITKKNIGNNDIAISNLSVAKRIFALHDASGSFKMNSGGTLELVKELRFEGRDKIVPTSNSNEIAWKSFVSIGVDGILTKLNLDANSLDKADTVTLNFTEVNNADGTSDTKGWSKDFNIVDLYHDKITTATVKGKYGVILQVWRKPNRSLIRVKNKPTVYAVEDGIKQPIPSVEVLSSQGLSFGEVEVIEQDEADTYADGDAVCYADGTLVKEDDENKPEVYVIADGEKKHIQNPKAFEDLFGNDRWDKIVKVMPGVLGLYRSRAALKSNSVYPEGSLIREVNKQTVYLVEGGKKKPITSKEIFEARKLDWGKVVEISKERLGKISTANETLQYPDGALVRDPAGKVYKMDQGKKLWVRSGDDFTGAGYSAGKIIDVIDTTEVNNLAATEEGNDIVADDI